MTTKTLQIVITGDPSSGKSTVAALVAHVLSAHYPDATVEIIHEGQANLEALVNTLQIKPLEPVAIQVIDDNRAKESPSLMYLRGLKPDAKRSILPTQQATRGFRRWLRYHPFRQGR